MKAFELKRKWKEKIFEFLFLKVIFFFFYAFIFYSTKQKTVSLSIFSLISPLQFLSSHPDAPLPLVWYSEWKQLRMDAMNIILGVWRRNKAEIILKMVGPIILFLTYFHSSFLFPSTLFFSSLPNRPLVLLSVWYLHLQAVMDLCDSCCGVQLLYMYMAWQFLYSVGSLY